MIRKLPQPHAGSKKRKGDLRGALAASHRAVAIFTAKSPGTPRHLIEVVMEASITNDLRDSKAALAMTQNAIDLAHDLRPVQGQGPG